MTHLASTYLDISRIHLWRRFWTFLAMRKPSYGEACDTMRLLEGHERTECGKILPFKRKANGQCDQRAGVILPAQTES